ncbi:MAG: DUF4404 family protein [Anaerolineae bacterium]|nr:DUF4404 family protein [Anaerolineae bacterium]
MNDPQSNRRELLEQLHDDLEQVEPTDAQGQQILDETRAEIQRALEADDDDSLVERLEDAVAHFEGTHPDLTNTLMVVIDTLSNMGL